MNKLISESISEAYEVKGREKLEVKLIVESFELITKMVNFFHHPYNNRPVFEFSHDGVGAIEIIGDPSIAASEEVANEFLEEYFKQKLGERYNSHELKNTEVLCRMGETRTLGQWNFAEEPATVLKLEGSVTYHAND